MSQGPGRFKNHKRLPVCVTNYHIERMAPSTNGWDALDVKQEWRRKIIVYGVTKSSKNLLACVFSTRSNMESFVELRYSERSQIEV